jgi:hypothetical protein
MSNVIRLELSPEDQELLKKNQDLVGKKFIHPQLTGSPVCEVLCVVENFPKDIVYQVVDSKYNHYMNVEFAAYVREHLIIES